MAFQGPHQKVTEVIGPPAVKHSFSGLRLTVVTTLAAPPGHSLTFLGVRGDKLCQPTGSANRSTLRPRRVLSAQKI